MKRNIMKYIAAAILMWSFIVPASGLAQSQETSSSQPAPNNAAPSDTEEFAACLYLLGCLFYAAESILSSRLDREFEYCLEVQEEEEEIEIEDFSYLCP